MHELELKDPKLVLVPDDAVETSDSPGTAAINITATRTPGETRQIRDPWFQPDTGSARGGGGQMMEGRDRPSRTLVLRAPKVSLHGLLFPSPGASSQCLLLCRPRSRHRDDLHAVSVRFSESTQRREPLTTVASVFIYDKHASPTEIRGGEPVYAHYFLVSCSREPADFVLR